MWLALQLANHSELVNWGILSPTIPEETCLIAHFAHKKNPKPGPILSIMSLVIETTKNSQVRGGS